MLNISRKDRQIFVLYGAVNFDTNETITIDVYNSSDVLVENGLVLNEIGTEGLYGAYFTPATTGDYKIIVYESAIKTGTASIYISDYDVESNGSGIVSINSLLEDSTYGLSALQTNQIDSQGSGFVTTSDSLYQIKHYLVNTIQDSISQIQNNTLTSVSLPSQMAIPGSGVTTNFAIYCNVFDEQGLPVDPYDQDAGAEDGMLNITVVNESGTDRSANLSNLGASVQDAKDWMSHASTGRFTCDYDVSWEHAKEQLNFSFVYKRLVGDPDIYVDRTSIVAVDLDVSSNVDYIKEQIDNTTYGLSAIKTLMDVYQTANQLDFTNIEAKIDIIDTNVDTSNTLLTNATYGLSALKDLIDTMTNTLTDIAGAGFVTATDSLKAIKDRVNDVFNKTGGYIT